MAYVDGFVVPVPKANLPRYREFAELAAKVWKEYGAVAYYECEGDDLDSKIGMPFPKLTKSKANETVYFSFIVYKSRAHRDQVNKKVMKDPRIAKMMQGKEPFDMKRMSYGGFKTVVKA